MDVGEQEVRVVLETIEHAVSVVRIDVHVGDPFEPVTGTQVFRRHTAVVEHAETGGMSATRMVQPGDRYECTGRRACHDSVNGGQRGADDV